MPAVPEPRVWLGGSSVGRLETELLKLETVLRLDPDARFRHLDAVMNRFAALRAARIVAVATARASAVGVAAASAAA
jgi:hypothetical protein